MANTEQDIEKRKENLRQALGQRFDDYMESVRKWYSGKISRLEFDREARQIVTESHVHLHNEFIVCLINHSNQFSSTAGDAAKKTIMPILSSNKVKKMKTGEQPSISSTSNTLTNASTRSSAANNSYNFRFVPVDPIKHTPSLVHASMETAHLAQSDFKLEFCARERTLPYARLIHGRMMLAALDNNLQPNIDVKAVFLLAEATVWLLKNIITKLASRSRFKHSLRKQYVCCGRRRGKAEDDYLSLDPGIIGRLRAECEDGGYTNKNDDTAETFKRTVDEEELREREELRQTMGVDLDNPLPMPVRKLPATLFDLKNLLQYNRALMPSHSIYTINMEKLMCNMWHETDDDECGHEGHDQMN